MGLAMDMALGRPTRLERWHCAMCRTQGACLEDSVIF